MQTLKYRYGGRDRNIAVSLMVLNLIALLAVVAAYFMDRPLIWYYIGIFTAAFILLQVHNAYSDNHFACPQCRAYCVMDNEERLDGKESWVQVRFYCKHCDIMWDNDIRVNNNPL